MKVIATGIIFAIGCSGCNGKSIFTPANKANIAGQPAAAHEEAAVDTNPVNTAESASTDCHPGSPSTVIFDKSADQLKYCDAGAWVFISKEQGRTLTKSKGKAHIPSNKLPKETISAREERLRQTRHIAAGTEKDEHHDGQANEPTNTDKAYLCRANTPGNRRSFHCQKPQLAH